MKIQLAVDLDLEFLQRVFPGENVIVPAKDAEILLLPGDICNGTQTINSFKEWPVPVKYLARNQEFYGC